MVVASLAALELVNGGTVNLDILVKSPKLQSSALQTTGGS